MDRETALQNYREAVSRKIAAFRSHMGDSVLEHAEDWEAVVEKAMKLLGEQMEKQGKEYVCFLYFSLLKSDTINRNYRVLCTGAGMEIPICQQDISGYKGCGAYPGSSGDHHGSFCVLRGAGWPLGEPEQGSIQIPDGSTGGRDNRTGAVCAYGCGGPYPECL